MVEESSQDPDWEVFRNKLLSAKVMHKGKEGSGPRYAVYDLEYELAAGEGKRSESVFLISGRSCAEPLQEQNHFYLLGP